MKQDLKIGEVAAIADCRQVRPAKPLGGLRKRIFDIGATMVLLVLFSPLLALIALMVKLSDGGAVFYGHLRVGHNEKPFRCLKFRTMVPDSSAKLAAHLAANPAALAEWTATRKLKHDVRVTPVGRVLRKLSLDELPQLINVLQGDMSLVGPRPIIGEEMLLYGEYADSYLSSRPGLTGKWQVSGRSDTTYEERVSLDNSYVQNWTLSGDLWIILKTVPVVLFAKGAC
ncbi:sugar transferase [Rhizobium sp. BE258]|uniref:sugar transferase n=1 Tax=Rhizobium sp. BE258 TaxID=2817722 RepID=UPI0028595DC0|nr:sugar transferase [Rhizobium sp. BE258]MDR7145330.1 exopolysaccharide production protein ExoY [Rhizobium sp. BE258]